MNAGTVVGSPKKIPGPQEQAVRDLIVIAILAVIVFIVSSEIDIFEHIAAFVNAHEAQQLDEIFVVAIFLLCAFVVFTYRRRRERMEEYAALTATHETLIRANRQMELMVSLTRHDGLNRISVALGYLRLIRKHSTEPRVLELAKKAEDAVVSLREQIAFTRDYQRIGGSAPKWQDPAALIAKLNSFPVFVRTELSGVEILADPLLEKVFFNLLENTVMHSGNAQTVRVYDRKEPGRYILVYEDDGIGVPDGEKCKIFDQGFGSHTGFGLFLVREILATTGIAICETGIPGKGARFEIAVPEGAFRDVVTDPKE